ncbi:MAG: DUF4442 domain-containing protein [Burkholderiales bacterium]|nr:DUF4442 domain-containing protein [Burkholderiales bacterium]
MSQYLSLFQQLGPQAFSDAVAQVAPYFGTIEPQFTALRTGHAELLIRNQRKVHNHIGTVHAIALCNGAELAAGVCTDVSIPPGARWLPVAMSVQYLAKARTDIRVVTEAADVAWSTPGNLEVPVAAYDSEGTKVFSAVITMNVKH